MNKAGYPKLLEEGLREVLDQTMYKTPTIYQDIFHVMNSDKHSEIDYDYASGNPFQKMDSDDATTPYSDITKGYKTTYIPSTYKGGETITRAMMDDDLYNVMNQSMVRLGRSAIETYDQEAAKIFINAFNTSFTSYGDQKPLCSTLHPRGDGGTAQSNASATGVTLTAANLKTAILALREVKDHSGGLLRIGHGRLRLIIPPALRDTAFEITQSELKPGGSLNDANVFYSSMYDLEIIVNDWISARAGGSDTAWFLQDAELHQLKFIMRTPIEFKSEIGEGTTFDTDALKFKGYGRFDIGWSGWIGFWGSKGDGQAYAN